MSLIVCRHMIALAAKFTIWSKAHAMKSANWNSTTGRRPSMAAAVAAPTNPLSLIGVSMTRSAPNSSMNPRVILNAPPKTPMSSPSRITFESRRISSRKPAEIASR